MPNAISPQQELFLRNRAEGMAISDAYIRAGYKVKSREVAFTNGSRMLRKAHIRQILRSFIDDAAEKTVVTRESLAAEIDQAAEQAADLDQPSVRVQAAMAKAKLYGLEAPSRSVNLNISGTFNQLTDDELSFEVASMINEARGAAGKAPVPLPAPVEKKH